jgi:hypothetical protein
MYTSKIPLQADKSGMEIHVIKIWQMNTLREQTFYIKIHTCVSQQNTFFLAARVLLLTRVQVCYTPRFLHCTHLGNTTPQAR